jgi:hypothetical protein
MKNSKNYLQNLKIYKNIKIENILIMINYKSNRFN